MSESNPERPDTVPADAFWDEGDNEWCLPERDSDGEFHGLVKWWRPDGTLCCQTDYVHGTADGSYKRFHENGEVSREGTFVEGKLHGTDRFYRSSAETTENFPRGLGDAVARAEMDYEMGRIGAARAYDKDDRQCMEDGAPFPDSRPDGVPKDAHFRKRESGGEYRWVQGTVNDNGDGTIDRIGTWRWWTPEGVLSSEESYKDGKRDGVCRSFDDDGNLTEETSWVEGEKHGLCRELEDGELVAERTYHEGGKRGPAKIRLKDDERGDEDVLYERGHFDGDDPVGVIEYLDKDDNVIASVETGRESSYEVMATVLEAEDGFTDLSSRLAAEGYHGPAIVALARAVGRGEADVSALEEAVARHAVPLPEGGIHYRAWYARMVVSNMTRFGAGPDKCVNTYADVLRRGGAPWETLRSIAATLDDMGGTPIASEIINAAIEAAPADEAGHFEYTRALIRASLGNPVGARESVKALDAVDPDVASKIGGYINALFPTFTFWPATDSRRAQNSELASLLVRTRAKTEPEVEPFRLAIQKSATRLEAHRDRLVERFGEQPWMVPSVAHLLPDGPVEVPISDRFGGVGIQHLCRQEWTRLTWLCFFSGLDDLGLPETMASRDDQVQTHMVGWARVFMAFGVEDTEDRVTSMVTNSDVAGEDKTEAVVAAVLAAASESDWFGLKMANVEDVVDPDFLHEDEMAFLSALKFFGDTNEDIFGEREDEDEEEEE